VNPKNNIFETKRVLHLFEHYLPSIKGLSCLLLGDYPDEILDLLSSKFFYKTEVLSTSNDNPPVKNISYTNTINKQKKYDVVMAFLDCENDYADNLPNLIKKDGLLFLFAVNNFGINRTFNYLSKIKLSEDCKSLTNIKKTINYLKNRALTHCLET
jgi:hypothetical protein